jgi:signal transduction histidine kinase
VETSQSTSERHRVRILTRDNEVRWLEVAACRVFIDGEPTSQLSTYDITDYVQLEEHLQRAQHFEAIGQLAAGISHEINTPAQYATDNVRFARDALIRAVSACQACTQSTTAPLADEFQEVPEALTDALDGLKRIRAIVQGVKAFAHPGDEESRPLDLGLLIDKAIDVSKNEWKHDATVSRSYSPDLPPVQCREAAFGQAMLNILVNSAQAIRERRRADAALEGHIAVAIRHDPTHVLITIQDNGVGIPREQQRRVFEPFFTTKAIGEGTGYGLSQVYNTVQGHHGTIWIESAENQGTTLTIRLPLASPEGSPS